MSNTYQTKGYLYLSSANASDHYSFDLVDISIAENPLINIFKIPKSLIFQLSFSTQ